MRRPEQPAVVDEFGLGLQANSPVSRCRRSDGEGSRATGLFPALRNGKSSVRRPVAADFSSRRRLRSVFGAAAAR
jgi:hypothetical protein